MLNGVTKLIMTKADVLSDFETIEVCTSYKFDGKETPEVPFDHADERIETVYSPMAGWQCDLHVDTPLPQALESYIDFVETETKCPISIVSMGPDRTQTMIRDTQLA